MEGSTAEFRVVCTGDNLNYQWRKDGENIPSATNSTLAIANAVLSESGTIYDCVISNEKGSVISAEVTLTVVQDIIAPVITIQPQHIAANVGENTSFSVSASGTGIQYQWYVNDVIETGATNSSFSLQSLTLEDDGNTYYCIVSNEAGNVTSNSATLTVTDVAVSITSHPSNQSVMVGETATFSVSATGTNLTYQWQKGTSDIDGATSVSYTTPATVSGDDGSTYRCVISNGVGSVTSNSSTLTVTQHVPYTVTYDGNGNTGGTAPSAQTKTQGVALTLATNSGNLVRTGYTFAGWNTAANGSGTDYPAGGSYTDDASVTLYAKWTSAGGETVTDVDGNVYTTVVIGTQVWTVENLRTTKYNDGTDIPHVTDGDQWGDLTTPGYCWYDNSTDPAEQEKWGALYNWYAVNTGKLAPEGWRVPTDADWKVLEEYLIAAGYNWDGTTSGNKIAKSMATQTDWTSYTTTGTIGNDPGKNNASGFSALPGGYRGTNGTFDDVGYLGNWWSATESDASYAYRRNLYYRYEYLDGDNYDKGCGLSVRLLRDLN